MSDEGEDGLDQFLEERREPIILRGNGNGSKSDEQETTERPKSGLTDDTSHRADSTATESITPTSSAKKPLLSELGDEGKEGHWLNSPRSNKGPTLMQRFKSKITSQSPNNEYGNQQAPNSLQFGSIDQATYLDLADIEKLLSGDNRSSQSSKSSDIDAKNANLPVSYGRRHEGLLPSPLETPSLKRTSLSSPVLLQAKTMTQVKAPQLVKISKASSSSYQEYLPKGRLRSVGRIPQVVRAGQISQAQAQPFAESTFMSKDLSDRAPEVEQAASIADETREFISFPPRKNSELSYSSSSGGSPCITRTSFVGEDEVWNEYDNLLDEISPPKVRVSTTSSFGAPFQYGDMVITKPQLATKEAHRGAPQIQKSARGFPISTQVVQAPPFQYPTILSIKTQFLKLPHLLEKSEALRSLLLFLVPESNENRSLVSTQDQWTILPLQN